MKETFLTIRQDMNRGHLATPLCEDIYDKWWSVIGHRKCIRKQKDSQFYFTFRSLFVCLFVFEVGGRERQERGRESQVGLHAVRAEPDARLDHTNHEIMTWAQIKSQMLNGLSHPGVPGCSILNDSNMCPSNVDTTGENANCSVLFCVMVSQCGHKGQTQEMFRKTKVCCAHRSWPYGATWGSLRVFRRHKAGVRGKSRPESLLGFPWERQSRAESTV